MIGSADATVDLIINASQGAAPPPGALLKFRRAQELRPANQGVTIIVESNLFARMLFAAFARVYPRLADLIVVGPGPGRGATAGRGLAERPRDRRGGLRIS